jgi:hypothetical protein
MSWRRHVHFAQLDPRRTMSRRPSIALPFFA